MECVCFILVSILWRLMTVVNAKQPVEGYNYSSLKIRQNFLLKRTFTQIEKPRINDHLNAKKCILNVSHYNYL